MKDTISVIVKKNGSIQYEYSFSNGRNFGCYSVQRDWSAEELLERLRTLQSNAPSATVTVLFEQ